MALKQIINGVESDIPLEEELEILNKWSEYDLLQESIGYIKKRRQEYPTVTDQLDMLFRAMEAGEIQKATEWFDAIQTIKDRYPKP